METARRGTKMLKASDIMKRKGIVQKQMDMNKFNEVVENFFMTQEPKDTILLTPRDSSRWITRQRETSSTISMSACGRRNAMIRMTRSTSSTISA